MNRLALGLCVLLASGCRMDAGPRPAPEATPAAASSPSPSPPSSVAPPPSADVADAGSSSEEQQVQRRVAGARKSLSRCHTGAWAGPDFEPTLRVRVEVSTRGAITQAELLSSTAPSPGFERCVLEVLRTVDVGPQPRPLRTEVTLTFRYDGQRSPP